MRSAWGHCPCGVAIPQDATYCARCEAGHLRLLSAIARQAQRDARIRERRQDAALLIRLIALCWFGAVVAPTWDHSTDDAALRAALVGLLLILLAALVAPRRRTRSTKR